MKELNINIEVDFALKQEQVESFQKVMYDKGLSVGISSITGTGFVHQYREPIMDAQVKPTYKWFPHMGPFPDLNKNINAEEFMDSDLTHMLFIDHDTVPKDRLCIAKMLLADKPVVTGIQAFKTFPSIWSVGLLKKGAEDAETSFEVKWLTTKDTSEDHVYDPWKFKDTFRNKLQRIIVCGNGMLMVKREVFEKIEWPWFGTEYLGNKDEWKFQGEDFWFSARCYQAKIPVYAHWGVKTEHMDGRHAYPLRFEKDEEGFVKGLKGI